VSLPNIEYVDIFHTEADPYHLSMTKSTQMTFPCTGEKQLMSLILYVFPLSCPVLFICCSLFSYANLILIDFSHAVHVLSHHINFSYSHDISFALHSRDLSLSLTSHALFSYLFPSHTPIISLDLNSPYHRFSLLILLQ
jgi:hypothetical protein